MNVIVDLEHTISNAWHRIDLKKEGLANEIFQKEFVNDRPNENVIIFMRQLIENGSKVCIVSAKKEIYRRLVMCWLNLHQVMYDDLIMKPDDCTDSSEVFKQAILANFGEKIDFALDDVGANCAMFARNNIPCLRIEQK